MILVYQTVIDKLKETRRFSNVLVYGLGEDSVSMIKRLASSKRYRLAGFITSGLSGQGMRLESYPVYSATSEEELRRLKDSFGVGEIIFPKPSYVRGEANWLVKLSYECGIKLLVLSVLDEDEEVKLRKSLIRDIKIEDILGRPEIKISKSKIISYLSGKTVLVTGAGGSIGSELCRQLAGFGIKKLIMFDNAETPLHNLRLEFDDWHADVEYVPIIGDVRTLDRVDFAFRKHRPQIVFHAAAYKHVPLMEENPCEAVRVNLGGTKNVVDSCIKYGAEAMVMISTDKAVNPTNVMGCSKRLAEIYVQSRGLDCEKNCEACHTRFVTTRFGNVLGSNGSVVPRFRKQIEEGGPVTVTHPEINRFFMTIPEACRLVFEAATMSSGNKIFVFDMGEPVRIVDLARNMIRLSGMEPDKDIKIVFTGLRPGEKLYEEVLSTEENSEPSFHERIRIAKVRTDYDYNEMIPSFDKLIQLSCEMKIEEMVALMKEIVPEYVSNNSEFERFDKSKKNV